MEKSTLIDPIITLLDASLEARGYLRTKSTFRKAGPDVDLVIDVQSAPASPSAAIDVTIELGAFAEKLEKRDATTSAWPAHWRQRIGYVMPQGTDLWWVIDSADKAEAAGQQIVRYVERYALPALREVASLQGLEALWRSGHSPGLTDMQRHCNLERLKQLQAL